MLRSSGSVTFLALLTVGCAGGGGGGASSPPPPATYTVGGTLTGLAGPGLVLQIGGGNDLPISASGAFTFTLPAGLRREHRTKPGLWGVIRALDGRLRYEILAPHSEAILEPGHPGIVMPEQPHWAEPLGPMRMQVEFYHQTPDPFAPSDQIAG